MIRLFSNYKWLILALSLGGVVLALTSTSRNGGIGVSPISMDFVSAAYNLSLGNGYMIYDRSPYATHGPMLPAILAAFSALGYSVITSARFLNAMVFGLVIFASGEWLLSKTEPLIALLGVLTILFSIRLIEINSFLWAEPVFMLFITLSIINIERFIENNRPLFFYLAAIFTSLSFLTRHLGFTMALTGLILLSRCNTAFLYKVKKMVLFLFISCLPSTVWYVRNYVITSKLAGLRPGTNRTLLGNIKESVYIIVGQFLPLSMIDLMPVIFIILILLIVMAVIVKYRNNIYGDPELAHIKPLALFCVIYLSSFITLASIVAIDIINDRFIIPIYVPLVLIVFAFLGYVIKKCSRNIRLFLLSLIIIYVSFNYFRAIKGVIYLSLHWPEQMICLTKEGKNSPLINYIKNHSFEKIIYSDPYAIYYFTGKYTGLSPRKYPVPTVKDIYRGDIDGIKTYLKKNDYAYLALFDNVIKERSNTYYSVDELKPFFKITPFVKEKDGEIYIIEELK